MGAQIRPADHGDVEAMYEVWYRHETAEDENPPRRRRPVAISHDLETGAGLVAEIDGRVVGFVTAFERSNALFVSHFFIDAAYRGDGIGTALLSRIMEGTYKTRHLIAEHNFGAWASYLKAGLKPIRQALWMNAAGDRLKFEPSSVSVEEGSLDDNLIQWDARLSGRERPQDWKYWTKDENGVVLNFRRNDSLIGYGLARFDSPVDLRHLRSIGIGPVAAENPDDTRDCMLAGLEWAADKREYVRTTVHTNHSALQDLLKARMQIYYVATYMASGEELFDARCYSGSDHQL